MKRLTVALGLYGLLAGVGAAEGDYQHLLELYRARRWTEAIVLVKRLIAEVPEPTVLESIATTTEATEMLRQPEWPEIQAAYFARLDAAMAAQPEIPFEIQCRAIKDQWARFSFTAKPDGPSYANLDRENSQRLKEIVAQQGWPRQSVWGERPAQAAWILLQHSPDPEFQAEMLPLLEKLLPEKECSAPGYALLYDRVQLRHGRPHRYGSQVQKVDGKWQPVPPLQDPERLDTLRAEMGLPPIAEYLQTIARMYDLPKSPPSRGLFQSE